MMDYLELVDRIGDTSPEDGEGVLNAVADWLGTFIKTANPGDLWALTLWAVHTHLVRETYTTPRLLLDSPAPGSGKTTVLDHLQRLGFKPVQAASLSSPSLLARLLEREPRTILIDEVDRTLNPKTEGVGELLAVLNSGYRHGATRPVLSQQKVDGVTEWVPVEMSTYGPVAMAGNAPDLPDDTRSRCIRVLLLPDLEGTVMDSDWQDIEPDALALRDIIAAWADMERETVKAMRLDYTALGLDQLKGRNRERWSPLLKVAIAAGGPWTERCIELVRADLEEQQLDREEGLQREGRHVMLLRDIAHVWPSGADFLATGELLNRLRMHAPDRWGMQCTYGELKAQGMGRMMVKHFKVRADRQTSGDRARGYFLADLMQVFGAFGLNPGG